jgi:hypothetical protein
MLDGKDKKHEDKLDELAELAIKDSSSDKDWLIFLDGDAFPVVELTSLADKLERHQLIAVQRLENLGEQQPHPSFCMTTVGFWKEHKCTWAKGYKWINAMGNPETDAGGELYGILQKAKIPWLPLLRSNKKNLNPVFFGIYGDTVYHHGAGFRGGGCRIIWFERGLYNIYKRIDARILNNIVPLKWQKRVRNSLIHPEGRLKHKIAKELAPLQQQVYEAIRKDPQYVRNFIKGNF